MLLSAHAPAASLRSDRDAGHEARLKAVLDDLLAGEAERILDEYVKLEEPLRGFGDGL